MRSKEVDLAIKRMEGVRDKNVHTFVDELTTVLAYIEELEKMIPTPSNEVPVEYQMSIYVDKRYYVSKDKIRDKIKELEEKKVNENDLREFVKIGNQIEVLKEIRGE